MNIFNGRDIMDLFVMEDDSIIDDVRLFRPLLNNPKNDIYFIAHKYEIPYLKDSTPDWSCRGVLRRKIMPPLVEQWGTGIMSNLAEIGKKSKEWDNVVNNFVLKPIYNDIEYKKNGCKIKIKDNFTELPKVIWMKIFIKVFHNMGCNMITRKNLDCFVENFSSNLKKDIKISFSNSCTGIFYSNSLYIFTCKFDKNTNHKDNFVINISDMELLKENENRNPITYDNILDGYYTYTEQYYENLSIVDKFVEKDTTKKIFSKICKK
jgi:tRNA(Ile)-lysidine synthase TilS/MesJ